MSEPNEVLDLREAAKFLGVSPDTLYRYAAKGTVPTFKLGNRWKFRRSKLIAWMEALETARIGSTDDIC